MVSAVSQNTVLTRLPAQLFTDLNSGTGDIILSEVNEKTETDSTPSCGDIVISNTTESSNTFDLPLDTSQEITCAVGYATGGTLSCDSGGSYKTLICVMSDSTNGFVSDSSGVCGCPEYSRLENGSFVNKYLQENLTTITHPNMLAITP